jgi:predicted nucleic acid-binding protein
VGKLTSIVTGKFVAFDSSPLIYYIEQHPEYAAVAEDLFGAVDHGDSLAITSVLTLLEVLVRPIRGGLLDLAHQYREILSGSRGISLFPVVAETCEISAKLRAKYEWIRTPDAIQVATALQNGADLIVTNDDRWRRLTEIQVLILMDFLAPAGVG